MAAFTTIGLPSEQVQLTRRMKGQQRWYTTPDGNEYPSVTTVLGHQEKPWLEEAGASTMAFRRKGKKIVKQFRCMSGEKKGRLVANAKTCTMRKNPKRMIVGRKVAAAKKGVRLRKSAITRNTAAHRMVRKTNKRLKQHGTRRPTGGR